MLGSLPTNKLVNWHDNGLAVATVSLWLSAMMDEQASHTSHEMIHIVLVGLNIALIIRMYVIGVLLL